MKPKFIKPNIIGVVYKSPHQVNFCSCGEKCISTHLVEIDEEHKKTGRDCFLGFCPCGNIFIAQTLTTTA